MSSSSHIPLVLHLPDANDRYQRLLITALNNSGVSSGLEPQLTRSATLNILLGPIYLVFVRCKGTRIIHLHYLFKYSVRWAKGPVARRLLRWWFGVWLFATRVLGLRLIWTAHNIMPHESIFDDDHIARRMLIRRADAVIALSEYARREIKKKFGIEATAVIPPGLTGVGKLSKNHATLSPVESDPICTKVIFVGRLTRYKGVDILLKALKTPIPNLVIQIAGECRDEAYAAELTTAARLAQASGAKVVLALERLSDEEYATCLLSADFAIFPFREITNSETVMTALSIGVPVLIPALDAFSELPEDAVLKWKPDDNEQGILKVLEEAIHTDIQKRNAMRSAALSWASRHSWNTIAEVTRVIYKQILAGEVKCPEKS